MSRERRRPDGLHLYYFSTCPYCIKVRIALWLMKIKVPLRNTATNKAYREELIAGGGKKQVPCLRIERDNGEVEWLYESSDIIRYLRQASPG